MRMMTNLRWAIVSVTGAVLIIGSIAAAIVGAGAFSNDPSSLQREDVSNVATDGRASSSGIRGTVFSVCFTSGAEDYPPCSPQPIKATQIVRSKNRQVVVEFTSSKTGKFAVELPPGKYNIEPSPYNRTPGFLRSLDHPILVPKGRFVAVYLTYDNGVR